MAKKNDAPSITSAEAIYALEWHKKQEMLWRMKAITLLQMVGVEGCYQTKLAEQCKAHAEAGLDV